MKQFKDTMKPGVKFVKPYGTVYILKPAVKFKPKFQRATIGSNLLFFLDIRKL